MKKRPRLPFIPIFVFIFLISACVKRNSPGEKDSEIKSQNNKTEFAKALAGVMTDRSIREFLKTEAMKQFDADHDVLYPLVKNNLMPNGQTFGDYLKQAIRKINPDISIDKIEQESPLINILIPSLEKFSAESWNTDNEIPAVAVRNVRDIKANKKLLAYKNDGTVIELDYHTDPGMSLIVIKDNEEIDLRAKGAAASAVGLSLHTGIEKYSPILEANGYSYYFADERLYRRQGIQAGSESDSIAVETMGCSRAVDWDRFDILTQQAFDKNIYHSDCPENTATVRDYVYYGIDPTTGVTQGPLKYNYREYITSIRCENLLSRSRFDDVTDGDILDFDFVIYTVDTDPIFPLKKRLSVPKAQFFVTNGSNPTPKPIDLTLNDLGLFPLELAVWNFKRQGDIWKIAIFEYDPSSTISETRSVSATMGTNFTVGEEKKGGKFGIEQTFTATNSFTFTRTDGSDDLGEAISYWCDPVIKEKFTVSAWDYCGIPITGIRRPPRGPVTIGRSHDIGTGIIAITVEPRRAI